MTTMTNHKGSNDMTDKCLTCQYDETYKATGEFPSKQARNHWSMWGCTCKPGRADEALAWHRLVAD
jgi:hypothetical protein